MFTLGATLLPFVIGFGVALILNGPIRGRGAWRGAFLMPWLVPSVIVSFLWLWLFNANYGVLNGILRNLGLIESNINWLSKGASAMTAVLLAKTWQTFPWIAVMLLAALHTIPSDHVRSGRNRRAKLGAVSPMSRCPTCAGSSASSFCFADLELPALRDDLRHDPGGAGKATTTFSVAVYQTAFQAFDLGKAGALGILWMFLLSLVVLVYLRFGMRDEEIAETAIAGGATGLYTARACAAVFAFFPIYWMLVTSLRPNTEVFAFPPTLLPQTFTLEHYPNLSRTRSSGAISATACWSPP